MELLPRQLFSTLSDQEQLFLGISVGLTSAPEVYIPKDIRLLGMQPFLAKQIRSQFAGFTSNWPMRPLGIEDPLIFSLENIDLKTGQTLFDPRVLGILDEKTQRIIDIAGRDLNQEYRKLLIEQEAKNGLNHFLR